MGTALWPIWCLIRTFAWRRKQEPHHAFVCTASLQAKIRTRDLWNTNSEWWRLRSGTTSVSVEWERIGKEVEIKYMTSNCSENTKDVQWRMFPMTGNLNEKSAQCWRSSFILLKYHQLFNTDREHELKIISTLYELGSCIRNQSQIAISIISWLWNMPKWGKFVSVFGNCVENSVNEVQEISRV